MRVEEVKQHLVSLLIRLLDLFVGEIGSGFGHKTLEHNPAHTLGGVDVKRIPESPTYRAAIHPCNWSGNHSTMFGTVKALPYFPTASLSSSPEGRTAIGIVTLGASAGSTMAGWQVAAALNGVPSWELRLTIYPPFAIRTKSVRAEESNPKNGLKNLPFHPSSTQECPRS